MVEVLRAIPAACDYHATRKNKNAESAELTPSTPQHAAVQDTLHWIFGNYKLL